MTPEILELDMSPITEEFRAHVMSSDFPWYFNLESTSDKFPYMAHTVIQRDGVEQSYMVDAVKKVLDVFCRMRGIQYSKILRAYFNSLGHYGYVHTDLHVDFKEPHKVFLFYMHTCDAHTLLFHKHQVGESSKILLEEMRCQPTPTCRIRPEAGKAVCFDGAYYHANEFPKESERRVVCVVCFE